METVLERGDIRFVYRPRVGEDSPDGLKDVQRLYAILAPHGRDLHRRLVVGRKRLPHLGEHERFWAYVDRVRRRGEAIVADLGAHHYETKTRGRRVQPAGRSAGEGSYAIVTHGAHVHLVYWLAEPHEPGDVQRDLGIEPMASYVVAVFNPRVKRPRHHRPRASFPAELQDRFGERRFAPLSPEHLDHDGAELVLIGASHELDLAEADPRPQ